MATPDHIRIPRPKITRSFSSSSPQTRSQGKASSNSPKRRRLTLYSPPQDEPTLFPMTVSYAPRHEHEPFYTYPHRYPLMYGSAEIVMCRCGCWRLNRGCNDKWEDSDVRTAIREAVESLEEL